jgi:hypothetical protein
MMRAGTIKPGLDLNSCSVPTSARLMECWRSRSRPPEEGDSDSTKHGNPASNRPIELRRGSEDWIPDS